MLEYSFKWNLRTCAVKIGMNILESAQPPWGSALGNSLSKGRVGGVLSYHCKRRCPKMSLKTYTCPDSGCPVDLVVCVGVSCLYTELG